MYSVTYLSHKSAYLIGSSEKFIREKNGCIDRAESD
jgi:hypothetical protein